METIMTHDFQLEVCDESRTQVLSEEPLWGVGQLAKHFRFKLECEGVRLPNADATAFIEPVIDGVEKGPYIQGIAARISNGSNKIHKKTYGIKPFSVQAQDMANRLVAQKVLRPNDRFCYLIKAFPTRAANGEASAPPAPSKFRSSVNHTPFQFVHKPVRELLGAVPPPSSQGDEAFDVYIAQQVYEQILQQAAESQDKEQAGFLIGVLGQDPETSRVYAAITAQTPALEGVQATCTSFAFSQETFMAARRFLENQNNPELCILGWQHSHTWCARCERREQCTSSSTIFWSIDDDRVHLSAFPLPFQVGLVVGFESGNRNHQLSCKLYGWADACVRERAFQVV